MTIISEIPPEQAAHAQENDVSDEDDKITSRGEKKARKALSKLGLKLEEGISRVTFKRAKNAIFAMEKPDVYKSATSDIWIVFGEAKVEDMASAAQQAQHLMRTAAQVSTPAKDVAAPALVPVDDDEEQVDATGIEPKDIEIVMAQANVSRSKAIKALKASDNDIVNAIMDLTM